MPQIAAKSEDPDGLEDSGLEVIRKSMIWRV